MTWYIKISLFYYQNTCDFKSLPTILQDLRCFYIVVRLVVGGIFYANAITHI